MLSACRQSEERTGRVASPGSTDHPPRTYALASTRACLTAAGAIVNEVQPRDARFQALRDLAQRNSLEASVEGRFVGIAFASGAETSRQLAELLEVPDDAYRIVVRDNVLLMYVPSAEQVFQKAASCLRE